MAKDALVICPVHNEGQTIKAFVEELRKHYSSDAVFIDDGSQDKSKEFLSRIKDKNTFLLRHLKREGYGQALMSGFGFALKGGYKRIITLDADLQHNPEHIPQFLSQLIDYEAVLGSRYIRIDRYFNVPRTRLAINRYICGLLKVLFSVNITDAFCGYRGYRDSFLKKAKLCQRGYGLALEILLAMLKEGMDFKEIPIEARYFNIPRQFLDGLGDPRKRLLYYLEIVSRNTKGIRYEQEVFDNSSASR